MVVLYIASLQPRAGKTALCASLGRRFQGQGKRVRYFKPLGIKDNPGATAPDGDASYLKQLLGLTAPVQELAPLAVLPMELATVLANPEDRDRIQQNAKRLAGEADILLVEGISGHLSLSHELAVGLNARTILIVRYQRGVTGEEIASSARSFGDSLLGLLLNAIPSLSHRVVATEVVPFLRDQGFQVLGLVPEERMLLGSSVRDIAEHLQAKIILNEARADQIVENFMVGALTLDSSVDYFQRQGNKAVITRGDRPDIQWCALETSTRCLLLTNNVMPIEYVSDKARELEVPIILTEKDTLATLAALESLELRATVHSQEKVDRYQSLLEHHVASGLLSGAFEAVA